MGAVAIADYPGTTTPITTDQRGEPLDVPNPDIGAFQSQGFTLTASTGSTGQSTAIGTAFANPLVVTVVANNEVEPVYGGVLTFNAPHRPLGDAFRYHRDDFSGAAGVFNSAAANLTMTDCTVERQLRPRHRRPGEQRHSQPDRLHRRAATTAVSTAAVWPATAPARPT